VTIAKSLDPNAGAAEVYAQEMSRVLLNLISNGFYATTKRKQNVKEAPEAAADSVDIGLADHEDEDIEEPEDLGDLVTGIALVQQGHSPLTQVHRVRLDHDLRR